MDTQSVIFVYGKEQRQDCWYVVQVPKLKVPLLKKMLKQAQYNLNTVGNILASGWGSQIPEDIRRQFVTTVPII